MAMTKVTFTLDEVAMQKLHDAATRLATPKSKIIRDAILDFHDRLGR
jgi:predicted transcriptional regulator